MNRLEWLEILEMLWSKMRLISKTSSVTPDFFYVFNIILSFSTCCQSLKKICTWEILGANVLNSIQFNSIYFLLMYFLSLVTYICSCWRLISTIVLSEKAIAWWPNKPFGFLVGHHVAYWCYIWYRRGNRKRAETKKKNIVKNNNCSKVGYSRGTVD